VLAHLRNGARLAPFRDHLLVVAHGEAQPVRRLGDGLGLAPFHQRAQAPDEPRVAKHGAAEHHRVDAGLPHTLHRFMRIAEVAVPDDRDVDGALELGDLRPVGAALVELLRGSRVQRQRLHARGLRALGDLDEHEVGLGPAQPHLHRHGAVDGRDDGAHDRLAAVHVAQARAAALGLGHLGRGAAEVDVDDVGAALTHQLRGLRHQRRIVPPELRRDRLLDAVLVDHLHRPFGAVLQGVGRHELRDREPEAERLVERPQGTIRHPRHRRENDGGPDLQRADLQRREPRVLNSIQGAAENANALTANANAAVSQLSARAQDIADTLQTTIQTSSGNIEQLTGTLNATVGRNSAKVDQLMTSLNQTAVALNQSMNSLRDIATNQRVKSNLVNTTQNIATLSGRLSNLAGDLRNVTGNGQTQGQLRDTVAQLDAATQKANSLLGTLGGQSHVYGVDAGATPYPRNGPTAVPGAPQTRGQGASPSPQTVKRGVGSIARNLYAFQFRFSELSSQRVSGTNPLLTRDRGPQTDANLILLLSGSTSIMAGANDIGGISFSVSNASKLLDAAREQAVADARRKALGGLGIGVPLLGVGGQARGDQVTGHAVGQIVRQAVQMGPGLGVELLGGDARKIVTVLRIALEPCPIIGATACQELKVLTKMRL